MSRTSRDDYIYVTKFDKDHLLSRDQIEIVKTFIKEGREISFEKTVESTEVIGRLYKKLQIEGKVKKTYEHIFMMEDGKTYTYVDYILGNPELLDYLKKYHPIELYEYDPTQNFHAMSMPRTD